MGVQDFSLWFDSVLCSALAELPFERYGSQRVGLVDVPPPFIFHDDFVVYLVAEAHLGGAVKLLMRIFCLQAVDDGVRSSLSIEVLPGAREASAPVVLDGTLQQVVFVEVVDAVKLQVTNAGSAPVCRPFCVGGIDHPAFAALGKNKAGEK